MVRGEILRWLAAQLFSSLPCSGSFLHPSPYGGGAGFRLSWVCPARPQLAHTAPTGPVGGFASAFPYSLPKTAHRATQGRLLFHRFFRVRSYSGRAEKSRPRIQFTASWIGQF